MAITFLFNELLLKHKLSDGLLLTGMLPSPVRKTFRSIMSLRISKNPPTSKNTYTRGSHWWKNCGWCYTVRLEMWAHQAMLRDPPVWVLVHAMWSAASRRAETEEKQRGESEWIIHVERQGTSCEVLNPHCSGSRSRWPLFGAVA